MPSIAFGISSFPPLDGEGENPDYGTVKFVVERWNHTNDDFIPVPTRRCNEKEFGFGVEDQETNNE